MITLNKALAETENNKGLFLTLKVVRIVFEKVINTVRQRFLYSYFTVPNKKQFYTNRVKETIISDITMLIMQYIAKHF